MGISERKYVRKPLWQPCWIEVAGSADLVACHIEDVSVGGARLRVRGPRVTEIPDQFVLRFSKTTPFGRWCAVRSRERDALGIQFVKRPVAAEAGE